jgi:hypothetical protein
MARELSTGLAAAALAQETGFLVLELLTITHADLAEPLRVVNNIEDVMHGGDLYTACGFELTPPEEKGEGQPKATLVLNNADQWLTEHIRGLRGGFDVSFALVSATDPGASPPEFGTVEQAGAFTPTDFRGMF